MPSEEINDVDVLKWQGLYGSSRVLFTIKEEEREEMEPQATDKSLSAETKSVSLGECLRVADELPELTVAVGVDEVTPFSTPCASPPYFTPPLLQPETSEMGRPHQKMWKSEISF